MKKIIYLDYSATTPVNPIVLSKYVETTLKYIGNPNSKHELGREAKSALGIARNKISYKLNCNGNDIIFTSGASESNATVIRGIAEEYEENGKHILTTKLEHKSILEEVNRLIRYGFKIEYINILPNGQVDLKDLEKKIKKDTILVSICGVNSEIGYKQDLKKIYEIIKNKNPKTIFHSDLTQALGKTEIDLNYVDLASFSGHKIFAPKGIGMLYKKENISIGELISGSNNNNKNRGGTPPLPLIVALSEAIKISYDNFDLNVKKCMKLHDLLIQELKKYDVVINSNEMCVPQIINVSVKKKTGKDFARLLSARNVYVSTTSACCSDNASKLLEYMTNDPEIYNTSIRISISDMTMLSDINEFMKRFDEVYNLEED